MVSSRQVGVLILVAIVGLVVVNYAPLGSDNGATENGNALTVTRQLPSTAAPNSSVHVVLEYSNLNESIDVRETVRETNQVFSLTLPSGNGTLRYRIPISSANNTMLHIDGNLIGYDEDIGGDNTISVQAFPSITPEAGTAPGDLTDLLPDALVGNERTNIDAIQVNTSNPEIKMVERIDARYGMSAGIRITRYRTSTQAMNELNAGPRQLYNTRTNAVNKTKVDGIEAFRIADTTDRIRWAEGTLLYEVTARDPTEAAVALVQYTRSR